MRNGIVIKKNKIRCAFFFLGFLTAYLILACASKPVNGPVEIPSDIAGLVHAGDSNSAEEYALLDKMGACWLLKTLFWDRVEPEDDVWKFDNYDTYVDTAKSQGKNVLAVLAYDTPWIHPDGKRHYYIPEDKMHFFIDYVCTMAAHFKGRVDAWCIWNEPNFNFWKGTKEEFFNLTSLALDAIREEDADVLVLGGAFNRGFFGLPKPFIRGLFETGAMEKASAVAFHPYELNPRRTVLLYNKFKAIVADYGFDDKIWLTEVGYPTGGLYPTATTEKKFPAFIVKTFVNLAINGAKKIMWYQLSDPIIRKRANSENYFGLVRSDSDYTSKGAEAFRLCATCLSGTVYRQLEMESLPKSLEAFYFEDPGKGGTLVLWKTGTSLKIKVHVPDGSFTVHDPVSGKAETFSADTSIAVTSMPVFVTWSQPGPINITR
ncbi:MAG: endo-1,4-beta-xylanase [Treponema sp.]|nr:endo-1,4-beta-xylanase [Treponema sp.]